MAVAFDIRGFPPPSPAPTERGPSATLPAPEHIHARCARKIGRHITRVMGSDHEHEDLVQEVLVIVLRKLDTVRDPACFDGWVAQITANTLKVTMRQRRLRRQALASFFEHQGDGLVETDHDARDAAARATRVMERMGSKERALLLAQLSTPGTLAGVAASVAANSGCSIATAQRRLSRARARFEKLARRDPTLAPRLAQASGRRFPKAEGGAEAPSSCTVPLAERLEPSG